IYLGIAAILVCAIARSFAAAPDVIGGTTLLTIDEPLDQVMVRGIGRFALREIAANRARRDAAWQRDFSSTEAHRKNLEPYRAKFREYIGAIDPRIDPSGFELVGTLEEGAI